jgi:hypothetical protein
MADIKVGDRVRVKDRSDWPSPPGYRLANLEGRVNQIREEAGFVMLRVEKTTIDILEPGTSMVFRLEAVEKS